MTRVHAGLLHFARVPMPLAATIAHRGYADDARRISGLQRELHSSNNSRVAYKNVTIKSVIFVDGLRMKFPRLQQMITRTPTANNVINDSPRPPGRETSRKLRSTSQRALRAIPFRNGRKHRLCHPFLVSLRTFRPDSLGQRRRNCY